MNPRFRSIRWLVRSQAKDADRVRSSASGVIHGLTLQMNPATDSCLRGHALFELGGTGLAIDLRDDTDRQSARLYDLVVEAVVGEREVSVHYVGDESIKEWVRACDAFAADKKFFRVRALTLGKATGSGPRPRPRSRSHG